MRYIEWMLLVACIGLFAGTMPADAADVAKIGTVDVQRVLENSSAGKAAKAMLKTKFEQMKKELNEKGKQIEELKKRLERERLVMNQEKREESERDLRIRVNDLKLMQKRYNEEIKKIELKIMGSINNDVSGLVEGIGKKEGYLVIFQQKPFVIYAPQSIDLTDQVIQEYNTMFSKGTGQANKVLK